MDRAEEIVDELVSICEGLGYTVELDRRLPVQENQTPLVVVRTGEEEMDEGSNLLTYDHLWTIRPAIELYMSDSNPSNDRAALNQFWKDFRVAFKQSAIVQKPLIRENTKPDYARVLVSPSHNPKISGQIINCEFKIKRID